MLFRYIYFKYYHITGILHSQRALAEVTEMIRTSNKLHKALLNYDMSLESIGSMNFGNKIALLSGDYLLSTSFHELACLKNHDLNELMSSALKDLVECDFIGPRDEQNRPLPVKPLPIKDRRNAVLPIEHELASFKTDVKSVLGNAKLEWVLRNVLGGASLLGKSCQGAMLLAGHDTFIQKQAYLFGRSLALAWQAHLDLQQFLIAKHGPFSLVCAPVLFHLEEDPGAFRDIESCKNNTHNVNYTKLYENVANGCGIEKTKSLQEEFSAEALEILKSFPVRDAHKALEKLIREMAMR